MFVPVRGGLKPGFVLDPDSRIFIQTVNTQAADSLERRRPIRRFRFLLRCALHNR